MHAHIRNITFLVGASVALAGAPTIIYPGVPPGFLLLSSSFLVIQYHTIDVLTFLTIIFEY